LNLGLRPCDARYLGTIVLSFFIAPGATVKNFSALITI
jgi:hypothetical protein